MNDQHTNTLLFIGLDVHKESTSVAVAASWGDREVRFIGNIPTDLHAIEKLFASLRKSHGITSSQLRVVYEAGPCGYGIARRCQQLKVPCIVAAPSMIPKKPGERVKTNRRDAIKLARLHRAEELTAVHVPDPDDEAMRDLCRARDCASKDQRRCRSRLKGFLLRNGYKYSGRTSWTPEHVRYLRGITMAHPMQASALEEYLAAIEEATARVERLTNLIAAHSATWNQIGRCRAVQALKGFQILSSVTVLSEIGDIRRFEHPRKIMAFVGLIPGEHSSGEDVNKTGITKCGNHQVRRILIESAQHYAKAPKVSKELSRRQEGLPRRIQEISWTAQNRLYKRFHQLRAKGKTNNKAVAAIARELVGFLWAILREYDQPGSTSPKQPAKSSCAKAPGGANKPREYVLRRALAEAIAAGGARTPCVATPLRSRGKPA